MDYVLFTLQLIAGFGIYNVWLLRFNQSTRYRGGEASSLKDEFTEYGLPGAKMYLIGFLKLGSATGLIIGCFIPSLVVPSAALLASLNAGSPLDAHQGQGSSVTIRSRTHYVGTLSRYPSAQPHLEVAPRSHRRGRH
jgi:hypothetical protein